MRSGKVERPDVQSVLGLLRTLNYKYNL